MSNNQPVIYEVYCVPQAYEEWLNLNHSVKLMFVKKLKERIHNPTQNNDGLKGALIGCYKIKLKRAGYRLIYQVLEDKIILLIWAIDKRDKNLAYKTATQRINALCDDSESPIKLEV